MKKHSILLVALSFTSAYTCATNTKLSEQQTRSYIGHLIETLFMPNNHAGSYGQELKQFTQETTKLIINSLGRYPSFFSLSKNYASQEVEQSVLDQSLLFIERKCKDYTQDALKKLAVVSTVNRTEIESSIVRNIAGEARKTVHRIAFLEPGVLTNFVGAPLYNRIYALVQNKVPSESISPAVYATEECPICYEKFNYSTKQMFLKCGHNLCLSCLARWFKEKGPKTSCPLCRAALFMADFEREL